MIIVYIIWTIDNSIHSSVATNVIIHTFPLDGNGNKVVPMEDPDILPELNNIMVFFNKIGFHR